MSSGSTRGPIGDTDGLSSAETMSPGRRLANSETPVSGSGTDNASVSGASTTMAAGTSSGTKNISSASSTAGVDAFKFDPQQDLLHQLLELEADRVFNILHGRGGEDGTIQAVLDMLGMPYTGSGVAASALTLDKLATKRLLLGSNIPTPDYMELNSEDDCKRLPGDLGLPVFVKPVLEGSSIGMTPVYDAVDLVPAWQKASEFGDVFAEKLIIGSEYTAAFLDQHILPLIKLETPREFYDYEAKYFADDTIYTCPSGLDDAMVGNIKIGRASWRERV